MAAMAGIDHHEGTGRVARPLDLRQRNRFGCRRDRHRNAPPAHRAAAHVSPDSDLRHGNRPCGLLRRHDRDSDKRQNPQHRPLSASKEPAPSMRIFTTRGKNNKFALPIARHAKGC